MENIDFEAELQKTERLGLCEVCAENPSKYTCPKCEVKTCSLKCIKIHKSEIECDGIRDKTKYKPLKQMTTMDFMNDYYFLEEATRFTKEIKTNVKVKHHNHLNLRFLKLRKEALSRNTKLYFINNALVKRRINQSFYKSQEQTIYWYVELIFPNASNLRFCKKFNENTKIQEILKIIVEDNTNEQRHKKLEFYRSEGIHNLRVLLKAEGLKGCSSRYHVMNLKKSLKSNLSGKVIIEFPTLFVVLNHTSDDFDVVRSDDECLEVEMKKFRQTLHEEVFSKKIGENPPLILNPEEVPIMSEILPEANENRNREIKNERQIELPKEVTSDDEVQPQNYFFSNDT